MELTIMVCAFLATMILISIYNHQLMRGADRRLEKANEMVLALAHSADKLSESVIELKELSVHLQQSYDARIHELNNNRNDMKESYVKLLHKYEQLEGRIIDNYEKEKNSAFDAIREMAKKPTISNQNTAEHAL